MSVTVLVFDGISPIRLDGLFSAICVGVPVFSFFFCFLVLSLCLLVWMPLYRILYPRKIPLCARLYLPTINDADA